MTHPLLKICESVPTENWQLISVAFGNSLAAACVSGVEESNQ